MTPDKTPLHLIENFHDKCLLHLIIDHDLFILESLKSVHTQLCLVSGEWCEYKINKPCDVTFCLKELRAIMGFTEANSLDVNINFEGSGK